MIQLKPSNKENWLLKLTKKTQVYEKFRDQTLLPLSTVIWTQRLIILSLHLLVHSSIPNIGLSSKNSSKLGVYIYYFIGVRPSTNTKVA